MTQDVKAVPPVGDCQITWRGNRATLNFSEMPLRNLTNLVALTEGSEAKKCLRWSKAAWNAVNALRVDDESMKFLTVDWDKNDTLIWVVARPNVPISEVHKAIVAILARGGITVSTPEGVPDSTAN